MRSVVLVSLFSLTLLAQTSTAAAATAFVAPSSVLRGLDAVHYVADSGETNDVAITVSGFEFTIVDPGATISVGPGCTSVDPSEATCSFDFDVRLEVRLGDGNDRLSVADDSDEGSGAYFGAGGSDTILGMGGPFSAEDLSGGPGNDILRGRAGDDTLRGGPGADIMSGGTSEDCENFFGCFPHNDTVTYAERRNPVLADADGVADDGTPSEGDLIKRDVEVIRGGSGDDVLGGKTMNVRTFFEGGSFKYGMELWGNDGGDVLRGWHSHDYLIGGDGNDVLHGEGSGDALSGKRGSDRLVGGGGSDHFTGGRGDDRLFARDGSRDRVGGGRGHDEARIDRGLDLVWRVEDFF